MSRSGGQPLPGTYFAPPTFQGASSTLTHASPNSVYLVGIPIPYGASPLTGLAYQTGGSSNGTVLPSLFSPAGVQVAYGSPTSQPSTPYTVARLPFTSPYQVPAPGIYFAGVQYSTGSTTSCDAFALSPGWVVSNGSLGPLASVSVPSAPVASALPYVSTY